MVRKSSCFEYHVKVGDKLSPIISDDDLEDPGLFSSPMRVPASAWLAGIKDEAAMIFEQSVELKRYNIIISLLWIDDDIN